MSILIILGLSVTRRPSGENTSSLDPSPSQDDLFEVLSNRRRRYVLYYLKRTEDGSADLSEVVEQVAAWENDTTVEEVTTDQRKSVYISLYQHHMEKMADAGAIEYDERSGRMELTPEAEEFDLYLETGPDSNAPWGLYFPILWVLCTLVVALGWLGLLPVAVGPSGWTMFALIAFGVSSMVFLYDTRYRMRVERGESPPEVEDRD